MIIFAILIPFALVALVVYVLMCINPHYDHLNTDHYNTELYKPDKRLKEMENHSFESFRKMVSMYESHPKKDFISD